MHHRVTLLSCVDVCVCSIYIYTLHTYHCAHCVCCVCNESSSSFAFPLTSPPPISYLYPLQPLSSFLSLPSSSLLSPFPLPSPPPLHADMRHPLMGAAQRTEHNSTVGERLGSSCVPPSIRDVTDNLRARIFSLCSKIGQCVPSAAVLPCCPVQCVSTTSFL